MYSFPNLELGSVVLCLVLTLATWPAYRFLRRQLRWSQTTLLYIAVNVLLFFPFYKGDRMKCVENREEGFMLPQKR